MDAMVLVSGRAAASRLRFLGNGAAHGVFPVQVIQGLRGDDGRARRTF